MDFITTLQGLDWASLLEIGLQLVGTFALIATMTKNSSDNVIADFLLRAVNALGGNVGRAQLDHPFLIPQRAQEKLQFYLPRSPSLQPLYLPCLCIRYPLAFFHRF